MLVQITLPWRKHRKSSTLIAVTSADLVVGDIVSILDDKSGSYICRVISVQGAAPSPKTNWYTVLATWLKR